jgi:DNA-binding winged helix-turn-helix (wHTH) protein
VRISFADFTLDSESRQLLREGGDVHLSPKAFDVVCLLAARRPNAVSKAELYEHVWPGTFVVDANLAVLVAEIRRALGDDPRQPRFIRTVHRYGYAFCSDVTESTGVPSPPAEAPRPRIWLVWNDRVLVLEEGETVVGRDPESDIWLDVPGVSRRHARIAVRGTVATLEDLGSTNGTFVDGSPVQAVTPLADGQKLTFGPVDMQFRAWSDAAASETVRLNRK